MLTDMNGIEQYTDLVFSVCSKYAFTALSFVENGILRPKASDDQV